MSTDQITQFWFDVSEMSQQIVADSAKQKLQKAPDYVYITSVVTRRNGISNARVIAAHLKLAAQRIVEGTHRLSSDEEIEKYLAEQERKREQMKSQEAALKGQITFSAPPPVPSVSK